MTGSLQVTLSALRSTAETMGIIGDELAGARAGDQIADAAGPSLSGLTCGPAVHAAAALIDEACALVGMSLNKLSDDLRAAAQWYAQTDENAAAKLETEFRRMDVGS